MKHGPVDKVRDVWKRVGDVMSNKLSKTSGRWWLSTSDEDIAWLCVRIDPFPKHYGYGLCPYMSSGDKGKHFVGGISYKSYLIYAIFQNIGLYVPTS